MEDRTHRRWAKQDRHEGDRWRLFRTVASAVRAEAVLYPGSYCDVAPSFVFPAVTYVDVDRRAAQFFADEDGVREIVAVHAKAPAEPLIRFIHADYTGDLDLASGSFDLLVSLYAGFVSEYCTDQLRVGGALLVNPSHGDAAMASIDPRYELSGVVAARSGEYPLRTAALETYLIPKKPVELSPELLHERGRGIAYTRSAFAYLFTRVA